MQKILIVNYDKCTGCRLCELVCSVKNTGCSNPARARIHVIKSDRTGVEFPMICQQCEDAPCLHACPRGAIGRDESLGRLVVDYDLCIGCRVCMSACPFGAMGFDHKTKKVVKCDLCDGTPLCADYCGPRAVEYVDATKAALKRQRNAAKNIPRFWLEGARV